MSDLQNKPKPDDKIPGNPSVEPGPEEAAKKPGPSEHAPYEKQPEPAQQPS